MTSTLSSNGVKEAKDKVMFFDNNFTNLLLSGRFSTQLELDSSDLKSSITPPFSPWRSPFALMELLGIKAKKLPKPAVFKTNSTKAPDMVEKAYRHFKDHYDKIPELDNSVLRLRAENQRVRVVPELYHFWKCYMANLFTRWDEAEWIRTALAFDAMQSDFSPMQCKHYCSLLVADCTVGADVITSNFSKMRLAYCFWKRCLAVNLRGPQDSERRRAFAGAQRLIKLDSHDDFLDCDIIHYATMGVAQSEGCRVKVTCVTNDSPDVIAMRIRIYKGFLAYIRRVYANDQEHRPPDDYERAYNGEIVCFDQSGKLISRIDVLSDVEPLDFIK